VWDPLVRVLHWTLAFAFVVAFVTGDEVMSVHRVAGYGAVGIVGLRAIWGLVGPRYARFADFVTGPRGVRDHLIEQLRGRPRRHLGHNPAGGAMAVALMLAMVGLAVTGILADVPGAAHLWEEVHEGVANVTLFLVLLHLAGVLVMSLVHHENLVRSMITGYKRR
jgi:cytochrome b